MAKLPTPARRRRRLRRLRLRLCDALDSTYLLRLALEYRQEPFPPPGVPYLEDAPAWREYLDRKTPAREKNKKTKKPDADPEQEGPSEDSALGVVYGHFEFSAAAATRLLDSGKGQLVVRNPDRQSLLQEDSERSVASGDDARDLLVVRSPDPDETLPEERVDISDTPLGDVLPQEASSPTSDLCQPLDLGDGRGCAPPDDSRDAYPEGHIFFWPPETAQAVILLSRVQPRLVSVPPPSPPPSAPLYRTSLSRNPRRRGVIFPFV